MISNHPNNFRCGRCRDTGAIYRDKRMVKTINEETGEVYEHVLGGIDVCPSCAAKAETEYRVTREPAIQTLDIMPNE